jgi:superfamily II DNA or RNA helicase
VKERRLFTDAQRHALWVAANGKCRECGADLEGSWHAHHIEPWAEGGPTEIYNGAALCEPCHINHHKGDRVKFELRDWQKQCFERVKRQDRALVNACPGAGKTFFAACLATHWIEEGAADFLLCVVPTTGLKDSFAEQFASAGLDITTKLSSKHHGRPPKQFRGAVCTYQQLPKMTDLVRRWVDQHGVRIGLIADEVHHASEDNTWGASFGVIGERSAKILSMSGTPFRGDGTRIQFIDYDEEDKAIADHTYSYENAVTDGVCREVVFQHDDSDVTWVDAQGDTQVRRVSLAVGDEESSVGQKLFNGSSQFLDGMLRKASDKVEEDRRNGDPDSACLVICKPGFGDDGERFAQHVERRIRALFQESPVLVTHDDSEADAKIRAFRKSRQKWIVAIRKVSEGVDIKRVRNIVLATRTDSFLLFMQMVGRAIRVDSEQQQEATVFMPKFAGMVEMAQKIEEQAKVGLRRKLEREKSLFDGLEDAVDRAVVGDIVLNATHEEGGITSRGDIFDPAEVGVARALRLGHQSLDAVPIHHIAKVLRAAGVGRGELPAPTNADQWPTLDEQLAQRRKVVHRLVNVIAKRTDIKQGQVFAALHRRMGTRDMEDLAMNHGVDGLRKAESVLRDWAEVGVQE